MHPPQSSMLFAVMFKVWEDEEGLAWDIVNYHCVHHGDCANQISTTHHLVYGWVT